MLTKDKLKETQNTLNTMIKEKESNYNELKNLQNKNKELLEQIKLKETEINNYKNNNNNINNSPESINIIGDIENDEDYSGNNKDNIILQLKQELKKKENIINEKEKEIDEFNKINKQLIEDNTIKQEKIQELMENSQQESFLLTLDNLKQEIKEHKKTISDLSNKNLKLNELLKSNKITNSNKYIDMKKNKFEKAHIEIEDEYQINNNYHSENRPEINNRLSRISGITTTSAGLNDQEKITKYKSKIREYKDVINSHLIQINLLKDEIKDLKQKIKSPIVENFDEFKNLFNIAFSDYKPSKKEQKEAFENIKQKFILF